MCTRPRTLSTSAPSPMPMRPPASASCGCRRIRTPSPSSTRGSTSPTRPQVPETTACTTLPTGPWRSHHSTAATTVARPISSRPMPSRRAPGRGRGRCCRSGGPAPPTTWAMPSQTARSARGPATAARSAPASGRRAGGPAGARTNGSSSVPPASRRRANRWRGARGRTGGHAARLPVSHPCTTGPTRPSPRVSPHSPTRPGTVEWRVQWLPPAVVRSHYAPFERWGWLSKGRRVAAPIHRLSSRPGRPLDGAEGLG